MTLNDVTNRADIEEITARFYDQMLKDPVVGFIFTDIAQIDLQSHLPVIVNFWSDIVFKEKNYHGNPLSKHLQINAKLPLKSGHFTRWLYLFEKAVDEHHQGANANLMKQRAEMIAKSFSAAISDQKRSDMNLVLPKATEITIGDSFDKK